MTFLKGTDFIKALETAGVIYDAASTSRVVIDAEAGHMVRIFVGRLADTTLIDVAPLVLGGVRVATDNTDQGKMLARAIDLLNVLWTFEGETLRREMSPEWAFAVERLVSDYDRRDEMGG